MSHETIAEHYAQLVGLKRPWQVSRVEVSHADQEVRIFVARAARPRLRCPECDRHCGGYDTCRRSWRHLDTMQYRTFVIAALGFLQSVPVLEEAMNDPDGSVRARCLEEIQELGDWKARTLLRERLKADEPGIVRMQAATSLGELRDAGSLDLLIEVALQDETPGVRRATVESIGDIPGRRSMELLVDMVYDMHDGVVATVSENGRGAESHEFITRLLIVNRGEEPSPNVIEVFLQGSDHRVNG